MQDRPFEDIRVLASIATSPKAVIAGAASVGVYIAALATCQASFGEGRTLPVAVARGLLGGSGARAWTSLVAVGWFRELPGGVDVEVSREFETDLEAVTVERRRELGRQRSQRHRVTQKASREPSLVTPEASPRDAKPVTRDAPSVTRNAENVTGDARSVTPALSLSDSSGSPLPSQPPRIADVKITTAPANMGDGEVTAPMADDAELSAEWAAAVQIFGLRDVADVWLKFRAHHIHKGTMSTQRGWRALFVDSWCRTERKHQAAALSKGRVRVEQKNPPKDEAPWLAEPEETGT